MIDSKVFRAALAKLMPGYRWTIHRAPKGATKLVATGTQTSGFNRLSTLEVTYSKSDKGEWFTARSAGVAGECDECGEDMPRLVHGRCGFCRDGRRPPPEWYEQREREAA